MVALDAASYLARAAALAGVPRVPPAAVPDGGPRPAVLRDGPYVSLAALMGVLALCWGMLSTGLPLWVTAHTQAPRWIVAVIVGLNSAAIAALQLRVSRSAGTPRAAARVAARAGAALALACALVAVTGGRGGLVAGAAHVAASGRRRPGCGTARRGSAAGPPEGSGHGPAGLSWKGCCPPLEGAPVPSEVTRMLLRPPNKDRTSPQRATLPRETRRGRTWKLQRTPNRAPR
jgi:hypothetical protein